jgi:hypothetical protein
MTMACEPLQEQAGLPGSDLLVLGEYFTRLTLAKSLHKSERSLARWEIRRIGPPVTRIGRLILYRRSSVLAWLASHEQRLQRRGGR